MRVRRRHVDDAAAALEQVRQRRPHRAHDAEQVEVEHRRPVVVVEVVEGEPRHRHAGRRAARVVHEDVEATEPLDGRSHRQGRAVRRRQVGGHVHERVVERASARASAPRDGGDPRALRAQGQGGRQADALRGSGHHGDPVLQHQIHAPSLAVRGGACWRESASCMRAGIGHGIRGSSDRRTGSVKTRPDYLRASGRSRKMQSSDPHSR